MHRVLVLERRRCADVGPRPDDALVPEIKQANEGGVGAREHGGHHDRAGAVEPLEPVGVAPRAAGRLVEEVSLLARVRVPDADAVLVEPALEQLGAIEQLGAVICGVELGFFLPRKPPRRRHAGPGHGARHRDPRRRDV